MAGRNVTARFAVEADVAQAKRDLEAVTQQIDQLGNARVDGARQELEQLNATTSKLAAGYTALTEDQRRLYQQREQDAQQVDKLRRTYKTLEGALETLDVQVKNGWRSMEEAARLQPQLAAAYTRTGQAARQAGADLQAGAAATRAAAAAQESAHDSSSRLSGVMGNLGNQIQDVAVQAQMGTNAFVIMAQQGPQIAGAFGPAGAAIGAVVAIASVAAGAVFGLGRSADSAETSFTSYTAAMEFAKKASEAMKTASEGTKNALLAEGRAANDAAKQRLTLAEAELKSLEVAMTSNVSGDISQNAGAALTYLWKADDVKKLRLEVLTLRAALGEYNDGAREARMATDMAGGGLRTARDAVATHREEIRKTIAELGVEVSTFDKSNAEKLRAKLQLEALTKAQAAGRQTIDEGTQSLINQAVARQEDIDRLEKQKKAEEDAAHAGEQAGKEAERKAQQHQKSLEQADKYIDRLKGEADALGMSERERFVANKAMEFELQNRGKLSGAEMDAYLAKVKEEAGALYDITEARKAKAKAEEESVRALEKYQQDVTRVATDIGKDISENLWDQITGEAKAGDALQFFKNWAKRLAVEMLNQQIVLPITMQIVGSMPSLFGIQAPAGAAGAATNGLTGSLTNTALSKAGGWAMDKLGLSGGMDQLMNTTLIGSAGGWAASSLAPSTGAYVVSNSALASAPFTVQAGSLNAATGVINAGNTAAANVAYSGAASGVSGSGITLSGVLGAAGPAALAGMGAGYLGTMANSKAVGGLSGAALGAGAGYLSTIIGLSSLGGPVGAAIGAVVGAIMGLLGTQKATVGKTASADVTINAGGKSATYGNILTDNEGDPAAGQALGTALSGIYSIAAMGGGTLTKDFGIGQTAANGLYVSGSVPYKEFGDDVAGLLRYTLLEQGGLKDGGVNTIAALKNTKGKDWEEVTKDIALGASIDAGITALAEFDKSLKGVENAAKKAAEANYANAIAEKERADKLGIGAAYADLVMQQIRESFDPATLTPLKSSLAALDGQFAALTDAVHTMGLSISDAEIAAAKAAQAEKLLQSYRNDFDAAMRSAQGLSAVDQAMAIRTRWNTSWQDDLAAGRNPTDLYGEQMKALFAGISDLTVLNQAAAALQNLDSVAAGFAQKRAEEVRASLTEDLTLRQMQAQVQLGQMSQDAYDLAALEIAQKRELATVTDTAVKAQLEQVQATERAAAAAKTAAEAQKAFASASGSTRSYLLSLMTGEAGGLSAQDRYRNAQNEYASASAAIGPQATAEQLARQTEAAKALLDASRAMNGSTTEYFRDLANVSGDLAKSAQITPDDPVVTAINALKASVDGLGGSITVQVSVDAINFVRGEIEQTIKTHVSTAGLSLREIQLANGVLDAVNQSVTVALSPATGLTARELQLYQGALSNIDQSITAAVDTSALTGANREIALGKLSDATRTINTALGVFPTMTAEQREFVLGASRDFARTVNGTLGVMPNLSAEQQAILLGQSDSFSRTFDAMAGKAPSLSAEQAAILSGTSDSFSRTFNGLVGVLPAMTGDQRAILLGVSDSFTRVYQQAVGVLPGMSYEQRAILTGYTDSFTKTFQSAAAAMPSMSMDQLAILRGQTDDFTRTFIAATNDLKLTPDEQAVLTAKSEQISRTITQKVETTETVDISRSIDDKLSKILDEIKAQMVAANTNLVTVNKSVIALASPNNPITVTSLFKGGAGMSFETGGVIPGGVVGNGIWGKDSVMARYAGGGTVNLAGGEGVLTAPATAAIGGAGMVDFINRTRSLPAALMRPFVMPAVSSPRHAASSDAGMAAELKAIREELAALRRDNNTMIQKQALMDEDGRQKQTAALLTANKTKHAASAA